MRFIHTADWHLGNSMHDIDRLSESAAFLAWLKGQIMEFGAEALLVSGDIFDTVNPSNEARSQYYRFLASLLDTCCKNVVVVGGNHDSAAMLDASKELLEVLNIQVVGSIWGHNPSELVRELKNGSGEVVAICAAVPYAREQELRPYVTDANASFADNAHGGLYKAVFEVAEALRGDREIPVIATGHLYASKLEGRPENDAGEGMKSHGVRDIVGNLGTVPVTVFPDGFDYVALGHIHYASTVAGNPKVRYSGSPFVLGFDEACLKHHILKVEVSRAGVPQVEKVETPAYFSFVRVEGPVAEIRKRLRELAGLQSEKPVKVEIVYDYRPGVNIREELKDVLESKVFEIVNWKTSRSECLNASDFYDESLDSVKELGEEEVFKRLIMKNLGATEMNEDVQKQFEEFFPMFEDLMAEVDAEN